MDCLDFPACKCDALKCADFAECIVSSLECLGSRNVWIQQHGEATSVVWFVLGFEKAFDFSCDFIIIS